MVDAGKRVPQPDRKVRVAMGEPPPGGGRAAPSSDVTSIRDALGSIGGDPQWSDVHMRNILVALAITASCGPPMSPFHPVSAPATEGAYGRALRAVVALGEVVDTKDEAAGVITTQWKSMYEGAGEDKIEGRWVITIAEATSTVDSQCRIITVTGKVLGGKERHEDPCNSGQPADRNTQAKTLADAIAKQ